MEKLWKIDDNWVNLWKIENWELADFLLVDHS